jgi:hypothetical protein
MATLEQLMLYGMRRKVEGIAAEMGYPKGTVDYPSEVLEEVKKRHSKKSYRVSAQTDAEQKAENVAYQDRQSVQQMAESLSSGLLVALDALTIMHCATRKFSDPKLQQAVDESQAQLREFLDRVANLYNPEAFLAKTPLAQIPDGENGSMQSLLSSSSSDEPKPNGSKKPSDKSDKPKDNGSLPSQ